MTTNLPASNVNPPVREGDFKYWAFISYSHRDEEFCSWLHTELETYKTPSSLVGKTAKDGCYTIPEKLYPIFRDREELAADADLGETLRAALRNSRYLVVICSEASAKSPWVNKEIEYFESLRREKYILPIILNGEPNSQNDKDPECFPPFLRAENKKEPLAADAREGKDGKEAALMKLRAGLLGVGLEDLVQRELQRQTLELENQKKEARRNKFIAAFMLVLAIFALAGGWFAWEKQKETDAEKRTAQTAKEESEKRRIEAEQRKKEAEESRNEAVLAKDRAVKAEEDAIQQKNTAQTAEEKALLARDDATKQKKGAEHNYGLALAEKADRAFAENKVNEGQIYAAHALARLDGGRDADAEITRALTLGVHVGKPGIPWLATLSGHTNSVWSIHFSPDGKTLASGSWDKTVRLWNVATGKAIATLSGHTYSVNSVHFSPDGKTLASGSLDNTVRLWPLNDIFIRDWKAQAAKDEKRYGLKLEGMKLVPFGKQETK